MHRRRAPSLAVLAYLAAGSLLSGAVPPWEAPDEPWHLAYAEALAAGRAPTPADTYEAHQPPLYYVGLAGALRVLEIPEVPRAPDNPWYPLATSATWHVPGDPAVGPVRVLRTLGGLVGALVVALAWATARRAWPRSPHRADLAAVAAALWPQFVFISHAIGNDVAAAACGAAVTYAAVATVGHGRPPRGLAVLVVAASAAAVLSKANAAVVVAGALVCALLAPPGRRAVLVGGSTAGILLAAMGLAAATPEVARRFASDVLSRGLEADPDLLAPREVAVQAARLATSLWARFGWLSVDPPLLAYLPAAVLALVVPLGLCRVLLAGPSHRPRAERRAERRVVAALAMLPAVLAAAAVKNLVVDPQPQGRFLLPALAALAVLVGGGLGALTTSERASRAAAPGLALVLAAVIGHSALVVLPRAYAGATGPPPPVTIRSMPPRRIVVLTLDDELRHARQSFPSLPPATVDVAVADVHGEGQVTLALDRRGVTVARRRVPLQEVVPGRWLRLAVPAGGGTAGSGSAADHVLRIDLSGPGRIRFLGTDGESLAGGRLEPGGADGSGDLMMVVTAATPASRGRPPDAPAPGGATAP